MVKLDITFRCDNCGHDECWLLVRFDTLIAECKQCEHVDQNIERRIVKEAEENSD